jgi:hypothetical protein
MYLLAIKDYKPDFSYQISSPSNQLKLVFGHIRVTKNGAKYGFSDNFCFLITYKCLVKTAEPQQFQQIESVRQR